MRSPQMQQELFQDTGVTEEGETECPERAKIREGFLEEVRLEQILKAMQEMLGQGRKDILDGGHSMGKGRKQRSIYGRAESSVGAQAPPRAQRCRCRRLTAGSPAWWRWMCIWGRSEVSVVLSRGARRCTLTTRAMGPPTTWDEAHLSSLSHFTPHCRPP